MAKISILENSHNSLSAKFENNVGSKDLKSIKFIGIPTYIVVGLSNEGSIIVFFLFI